MGATVATEAMAAIAAMAATATVDMEAASPATHASHHGVAMAPSQFVHRTVATAHILVRSVVVAGQCPIAIECPVDTLLRFTIKRQ